MKIILASSSLYRRKVLADLGLSFKIIPSLVNEEEIKNKAKSPEELVKKLALLKAKTVRRKLLQQKEKDFLIIAADSTAVLKNNGQWQYFDKPKNRQEANKMALLLRGKKHQFYTGLVVISSLGRQKTAVSVSNVYFKSFSDKTRNKFLASGIWRGRAGGYDIKENKSDLIDKFEGSYTNILGLPLEKLIPILEEFGIYKYGLRRDIKDKGSWPPRFKTSRP